MRALSRVKATLEIPQNVGSVRIVISPWCAFSTSMKRLMCVPLNSCGRLTDIVAVAIVCCRFRARSSTTIGIAQVAHAHLVNRDAAVIRLTLDIFHLFVLPLVVQPEVHVSSDDDPIEAR